mmetsp:Transcript_92009/g.249672  ORF Transcript_92009/g.249672 Transcript_92009/m.249672 type:complete len:306 (+) Transcript_92009:361-1278(+)
MPPGWKTTLRSSGGGGLRPAASDGGGGLPPAASDGLSDQAPGVSKRPGLSAGPAGPSPWRGPGGLSPTASRNEPLGSDFLEDANMLPGVSASDAPPSERRSRRAGEGVRCGVRSGVAVAVSWELKPSPEPSGSGAPSHASISTISPTSVSQPSGHRTLATSPTRAWPSPSSCSRAWPWLSEGTLWMSRASTTSSALPRRPRGNRASKSWSLALTSHTRESPCSRALAALLALPSSRCRAALRAATTTWCLKAASALLSWQLIFNSRLVDCLIAMSPVTTTPLGFSIDITACKTFHALHRLPMTPM